jgi:antitoxin component YwqK of YwqJK toxin-antitoxin module
MRFFLFFLLMSSLANAQIVHPIYFYGDKIVKDKDLADSYAIYGKLTNEDTWLYKRYDLYDNLLITGAYEDGGLVIPKGKFVFYGDIYIFNRDNSTNFTVKGTTRFVAQEGFFKNGEEEGKWKLFFPDGNIQNYQSYRNGVLDGEFKTFNRLGQVIIDGKYKNGKMDGEWVFVKEKKVKIYKDDVLLSTSKLAKNKTTVTSKH